MPDGTGLVDEVDVVAETTLPAADDTDGDMSSSTGRDRTLFDMFTTAYWSFDLAITMSSRGACDLRSRLSASDWSGLVGIVVR